MVDSSNPNFDIAKQQVIHGLEKLAKFSSDMDKKYPTCGFAPFVQRLRQLEGVIQITYGPCLSSNQIHEIESFAQHLSSNRVFIDSYFTHHGFLSKLQQFWRLRQSIVNMSGKVEEIILWRLAKKDTFQNTLYALRVSLERTRKAQRVTNQIVDAVIGQTKNLLSMTSILLAIVIRVEAHEYEIQNMIAIGKNYVDLNYDIQEMCSVESKVQKGSEWRSDTRAIRDAVSHAHFTINDTGNGYYEIHFKNFEQGYRFDKTFTQKELLYFYQDYDRLIAIQTLLLDSALIQDFLLKEFKN